MSPLFASYKPADERQLDLLPRAATLNRLPQGTLTEMIARSLITKNQEQILETQIADAVSPKK